jgi:hypothetical protein
MNEANLPGTNRGLLRRFTAGIQNLQKNSGAIHVLVFMLTLFGLALVITSWIGGWKRPPLGQIFICISIATLLAGFAALILDVLNRLERLGYFLLVASLTRLYWAEQEREQYPLPTGIPSLIKKMSTFPPGFLQAWARDSCQRNRRSVYLLR